MSEKGVLSSPTNKGKIMMTFPLNKNKGKYRWIHEYEDKFELLKRD